ncbi:LD-carboxypeptidase [Peredibacter sp. HCB2-198]|uniref:S66 peptidase family protein n=1 Tax=Peredibacter sp. HCB2-198 TaxID=3383025 RepID=UPI0038B610C2
MKIIKPNRLQSGQNIGVVALSTPAKTLKPDYRARAYKRIKELFGLNIIEAPNLDHQTGHTAGTIKERVKSLHDFFKRKDIHGIMSFWGGFNTHQVLEYLDYDLIKANPKVLVGYSDTTNLLSGITQKTGLVTFNGPAIITFAKSTVPDETIECFRSLVMETNTSYSYPVSKRFSDNQWWIEDKMEFSTNPGLQTFKKGKAEGRIVGGNIGTLLLLAGTPYFPSMKGKILFIEDDEAENPKTLDRYFTQLRQMGVFDKINGMVIGRFARCVGLSQNDSLNMILNDSLKGHNFPVITEFDMGHTDPIMTVPIGAKVSIDANKKKIVITETVNR